MNILFISGSYPPKLCGIGDYTKNLLEALENKKQEVHIIANINWSINRYKSIVNEIININPDVIHIQYPSLGFERSLLPQILSLRFKTIVTIHEVIQAHPLRKFALLPFSIKSKMIFTNRFDMKAYLKLLPFSSSNNYSIIPIGSNIPNLVKTKFENKDLNTIVFFGQIRPNRGLEDTILLAKLIKENNLPHRLLNIGQVLNKKYYDEIVDLSKDLPIDWKINLSSSEVSNILSKHLLCYLPYPDGVSERRGSLLAALCNDMIVFTTKGQQTTDQLIKSVHIISSPSNFCSILINFTKNSIFQLWLIKNSNSREYIKTLNWSNIAELHLQYYQQYL